MRFLDYAIEATLLSVDNFFRATGAVAPDQIGWKPFDTGRSVLELVQEVTFTPLSFAGMLRGTGGAGEADGKRMEQQFQNCQTLEQWHEASDENTKQLLDVIRGFSDSDLERMINVGHKLPLIGGPECPIYSLILFHRDNTLYHTGQINYIQTLYGDHVIHEIAGSLACGLEIRVNILRDSLTASRHTSTTIA